MEEDDENLAGWWLMCLIAVGINETENWNKPGNVVRVVLWGSKKLTFRQDLVKLKICLSWVEFYLRSIPSSILD